MHTTRRTLFLLFLFTSACAQDVDSAVWEQYYNSSGITYIKNKYDGHIDRSLTDGVGYVTVTTSNFSVTFPTSLTQENGALIPTLTSQPTINHYALTRLHQCKAK